MGNVADHIAALVPGTGSLNDKLIEYFASGGGSGKALTVTDVVAAGAAQLLTLPTAGLGVWDVTLTAANCTFTFGGAVDQKECIWTIYLRQDATGGRLATFTGVTWPGGVVPVLSTAPGVVDTISIVSDDGGATKWGYYSGAAGIPASILTAKGSLIAATAAGVATNLPVGTNDQVLTADSAQAPGVKWATPSSNPTAPMTLTGTSDVVQLTVKDVLAQTADAMRITDSLNSVLMRVTAGGVVSSAGETYTSTLSLIDNAAGSPIAGRKWHVTTEAGANPALVLTRSGVADRVRFKSEGWVQVMDSVAPAVNPVTSGFIYVEAGALKYRGSAGTITTLAVA